MLEFLTLTGLSAGAQWLVKDVLGPLTKSAAEDFYKDFLKQSVSDRLAQVAPAPLKRAIAQSLKEFIVLFQGELEYSGWPGALVNHEFAQPLKRLLADAEVKRELGKAFDTDTRKLNWQLIEAKWEGISTTQLPPDFDWEQLIKSYVRFVKDFIRSDAGLAEQLKLDRQEKIAQSTAELVGVPVDFDLTKYQESLREKFGSLSLDSLDTTGAAYDNLRLWKIFVAQDVRECAEFAPQLYELPKERLARLEAAGEIDELMSQDVLEQRRKAYVERPVESVRRIVGLDEPHQVNRAVILGDPGSGKSTLLRCMALRWAERPLTELKDEPLPILIELRLYAQDKSAGTCNSFLEYLHKGNVVCRLNQIELDKLLKSGDAVVLFDGIDEVFDPKLREAVVNDIHRFSNDYSAVQIVVTSRWLGYKSEALRNAEFQHYMLQDLNLAQIENFVERWHELTFTAAQAVDKERKRDRLQKAVLDSKPIRELAGNPLLLTMMAILNRNRELPRDRAQLYKQASEVLLYQWDVEGKLYEQPALKGSQIEARDKQAMLRKVAYHMQANATGLSGNVISREDLEGLLIKYLKAIEVPNPRAVAKIMIEQLRERNFILCYLGADNYAFVHRTFLEYFCADEFVWKFEKGKEIDEDGLKELYATRFQDEAWDEVLRLIAGIVEPRFVGEIIEHLLAQSINLWKYLDERDRLKPEGIGNFLLAADCLAEVRTRNEISKIANRLLARLKQNAEVEYPYWLDSEAALALTEAIATNWKERDETLTWLTQCLSFNLSSYIPESALQSICRNWKDDPDTLPILKTRAQEDENYAVRLAAVQELARGWKDDPDTLPILKTRAQEDENYAVRRAAVQELARGWKDDPDMLPILKTRAQEDEDNDVRLAAVQELARGWKDDPDMLPWLKTRAQEDENYAVRRAAVQELARGWKDDLSLLDFWCDCALQDPFQREYDFQDNPRQIALQVVVQQYPEHSQTVELLRDRAQNDSDEQLRTWATEQLKRFTQLPTV